MKKRQRMIQGISMPGLQCQQYVRFHYSFYSYSGDIVYHFALICACLSSPWQTGHIIHAPQPPFIVEGPKSKVVMPEIALDAFESCFGALPPSLTHSLTHSISLSLHPSFPVCVNPRHNLRHSASSNSNNLYPVFPYRRALISPEVI